MSVSLIATTAPVPLYEALLIVALAGLGVWRLKGVLGDGRRSPTSKRAHAVAHAACLVVGLLIAQSFWGAAIGLAGAGIFPLAEELLRKKFGNHGGSEAACDREDADAG